MTKELLFSVTAADCRFDYYRGSGKGGQKRNKTSNCVRCTHIASGAVGRAEDTRSQHDNKKIAFGRMALTEKFKAWHRIETARRTGALAEINEKVDRMMNQIQVDYRKDGKWVPEQECEPQLLRGYGRARQRGDGARLHRKPEGPVDDPQLQISN